MKKSQVFDPTALERAAAAVRELNNSPHAAKALEAMIKAEEAKKADRQAVQKQAEVQKARVEGEERRQSIDYQKQKSLEIAEHNDKLERSRLKDKIREQELSAQRMREEAEETTRRQEEMRRETMRFQMQKQSEIEEKKLKLQYKLEAENYRKNFDLKKQEKQLKYSINASSRQELHNLYLSKIQDAFQYFQHNPSGLLTLFTGTLYITGAFFLTKYSLGVAFRTLEAYLAIPPLVRETSRRSIKWFMPSSANIFNRIVLNDQLQSHLQLITAGLIAKQRQAAPLRNFLFHGKPGTGKTLFAKLLAHHSGLHYAVISGGDIEKLGDKAVPQIDKLFNWCQSTPRGTLVFIDEAEAIFYKRDQIKKTSSALSAFLAQTSEASSKFSIILATNIPSQLDKAILDRMDQIIQFDYLDVEHRIILLNKGFNSIAYKRKMIDYIMNPMKIFINYIKVEFDFSDEDIRHLAKQMENFSPRQIDKFILSVYDSAIGQCVLDKVHNITINIEFADKILKQALEQNELRSQWSV